MYIASECESVCVEYNKMVKARTKKISTIWSYIFLGFIVVMIILPMIPNFLNKGPGWVLYIIYGGLVFVGLSIALLISIFSISNVPAFEYLYRTVYNKINQERDTFYKYEYFEKGDFTFNSRGGIFPRSCRYKINRHVSGISPEGNKFDIYDVALITGSGKNQSTHFSGMYYVTKQSNNTNFQLRTNGKPHLKGVKFERFNDFTNIKVYIEEEKNMTNIEHKFMSTVDRLTRNLNAKKIYLSLTKDEIHLAVVPKVHIRKQYNLSIDKMNKLYNAFLDEVRVIDELAKSNDY